MEARQLFRPFISDMAAEPTVALTASPCTTTLLPSDGVLTIGEQLVTLTQAAVFTIACPSDAIATAGPVIIANNGLDFDQASPEDFKFSDFRDPFYASTFPVCYALAATTVTAYMLVIMLFITPRSFLDGGVVYLGRRGFTSGSSGGVSIGGRPWLQKVAALTVAISLTIATADTFRVAEKQYSWNIQNATQLQLEVMDGTELKVIRLISDTFLWLAQAQTLIRLFPRQREKVIIKWTAFALITLDVIFSALNSFHYTTSGSNGNARPRSFVDAVPALSYLFQLSLGLLYAAWVIYYSLMKKRYAYYHPLMKNMMLVAVLSLFSILVPVVFFVLDISKPEFIGWGDYVRWVGAAAASVVVWEWVERIEALEREEKKDGILGREVFDGDEMLEISASEFPWLRRRKNKKGGRDGGSDGGEGGQAPPPSGRANIWPGMTSIAARYRGNQIQQGGDRAQTTQRSVGELLRPQLWPSRPAPAVTPISRTDTASAASTVYAVRYQPMSEATSQTPDHSPQRNLPVSGAEPEIREESTPEDVERTVAAPTPRQPADASAIDPDVSETATRSRHRWRSLAQVANPLARRAAQAPPAEVLAHTALPAEPRSSHDDTNRWDLRARLEDFAATQAEKIRDKMRPMPETDSLPVTVIPAPPRRGAALAQLLEEEENSSQVGGPRRAALTRSSSDTTAFSSLPPVGGMHANPMERTTTNFSTRSRPFSQQPVSPTLQLNRPPLWPGIQVQYDYDQAPDDTPSVVLPRRPRDDSGPPPIP